MFNLGAERGLTKAGPEKSGWWPLSFVIAAGLLSSVNSLELVTLNSATAGRLLVYGQAAVSTIYLIREFTRKEDKYRLKIDLLDNLETRFNRALAAVSFGIICVFSIAISAPLSWDSNAFNLARVPIFMFENNLALSEQVVSDARQAIYPFLHDALYAPDLIAGNTRGLTLIGTVELAVIFGLLLLIFNKIWNIEKLPIIGRQKKRLRALCQAILITGLASNSQQILQSINTKNDLFITLLACQVILSILLLIDASKGIKREDFCVTLGGLMLAVIMSIAGKAYGIINLIPIGIALTLWTKRFMPWNYPIQAENKAADDYERAKNRARLILTVSTSILVGLIYAYHSLSIDAIWDKNSGSLIAITTGWTNMSGSINERLINAVLHVQRLLAQTITFPVTASRAYMPLLDGIDTSFMNDLMPTWLYDKQGAVDPFELHYHLNLDRAFPFLISTIILITGVGGILSDKVLKRRRQGIFFVANSAANLCVICSALYYNSFMSRYLGPVFIPILPIASLSVGIIIDRLMNKYSINGINTSKKNTVLKSVVTFITVMPVISAISLSQYISTSKGIPQDYRSYYSSFLVNQLQLEPEEASAKLDQLEMEPYKKRTICSDSGNLVLIPIMLSMNNNSYNGDNLNVRPMDYCNNEQKSSETQYVRLPFL